MAARNNVDTDSDPRAIVGTREYDAPRDLVFAAFTDPSHLAQWWGPNGFKTTTLSFDMRPGGVWRFVMHGPDGRDYQIALPTKRSCRRNASSTAMAAAMTSSRCSFGRPSRSKTLAVAPASSGAADFPTAGERDRLIKEYGADTGLMQTMARLADYLATQSR